MVFEHIEKLKREYTDKYVAIGRMVPELQRFEGRTGIVRTVNMSGRALVEFLGSNDISWYDIDVDFLKIVEAPPQPVAKEKPQKPVKANDESPASKQTPAKKPAASTADILAMARGKRAEPTADKPREKKPTGGKPSTADILAKARGKGTPPAKQAEAKETPPKEKDEKSLSTAEKLAMLRGEKSPPKESEGEPAAKKKPSTADILAMARGKKPAPEKPQDPAASESPSEEDAPPKKPSTADILAMARGQTKPPKEKSNESQERENPPPE